MTGRLPDLVVAGVNKAGTTSLYAQLVAHPDVCGSSVKETCYFLPIRYGRDPEPLDVYRAYFGACGGQRLAVEATPGYFYGGAPLAHALDAAVPGVRVVIVLREPVSRLVSFFRFQQSMLHLPDDITFAEYVQRCDGFSDDELQREQDLNPWFGVLGGHYDRWLSAWLETFGARLRVLFADALAGDPRATMRTLATWLDLDPGPWDAGVAARENATTGYRSRAVQRGALALNRRFERFWRAHPGAKRMLRDAYRRVNAGDAAGGPDDALRAELAARYQPSMERTAAVLRSAGVDHLPDWLA